MSNFDLELVYLAGFFDGEGCVHVTKPDRASRQSLVVRVTQTDPAVLLAFEMRWGGRITTRENGPRCKPIWIWAAYSQDAATCLHDLLPYLRVKSAAAEVGIRFQDLKTGDNNLKALQRAHPRREEIMAGRRECADEIRVLNKRGTR